MKGIMFDGLHQGMGQVLDLRRSQHQLTASNLANAETPGYKAKVIPFNRILAEAVDQGQGTVLNRTDDRHMPGLGADPDNPEVSELEPPPWALNDNSVVSEREATKLKENALMYRSIVRGMSRRLQLLKYASGDGR